MRIWPNVTDGNLRKKDQMNDTDYMTEVADVLDMYICEFVSVQGCVCALGESPYALHPISLRRFYSVAFKSVAVLV